MLMIVFLIETMLRAIVCSNFVSKVLSIKGFNDKQVTTFQIVYYGIIIMVILAVFVLALITTTAISCEAEIYSYHWFIIDGVDTA